MQTIEGFDFFPLVFEQGGKLQDPDELDALPERAAAAPATDPVFIAHGFRNDVGEATRLYTNFLKNFRADLARPAFRDVASRTLVVGGVYWPACTGRRRHFAKRSAMHRKGREPSTARRSRWPTPRSSSTN